MRTQRFSVIIPTRERHDTLRHAIESVLQQTFADFELIIMDNCSSPLTAEVVSSFQDGRINYYRSDRRLSMVENWEQALRHALGEYVCFIGDDDGFMPDGLALAEELLRMKPETEAITWQLARYYWDSSLVPWLRNLLIIHLGMSRAHVRNSRLYLRNAFSAVNQFASGPGIYHGFVSQNLIRKVRLRNAGSYFLKACMAPDICSALTNGYFTEEFLSSDRPLTISGISGHSNGMACMFPSFGRQALDSFLSDQGINEVRNHPSLIQTTNPYVGMASDFLVVRDTFFPNDPDINLDVHSLICQMVSSPDTPDPGVRDVGKDVRLLAEKYGIDIGHVTIPDVRSEAEFSRDVVYGPIRDASGSVGGLRINCKLAGVTNVAQSAKLAWSILDGRTTN